MKPKETPTPVDSIGEAIAQLGQIDGMREPCHVTTFEAVWTGKEGIAPLEIIVDVLDGGSAEQDLRYICRVTLANGKRLWGGGQPTLPLAIKYGPWGHFEESDVH